MPSTETLHKYLIYKGFSPSGKPGTRLAPLTMPPAVAERAVSVASSRAYKPGSPWRVLDVPESLTGAVRGGHTQETGMPSLGYASQLHLRGTLMLADRLSAREAVTLHVGGNAMRVHKARGADYDVDKERQYNWWRPGKGERRVGAVHHLSRSELQAFAEEHGLELSENCTFRVTRHS